MNDYKIFNDFLKQQIVKNEVIHYNTCLKNALQDIPEAQFKLGLCYQNGNGVEKDEVKAYNWFLKSALHNYGDALNAVGNCYRFGRGVKIDINTAIEWYLKAIKQNNVHAMNNLGSCYRDLDCLDNHFDLAFEWYMKAAGFGYEYALNNVGSCYRYGRGVEIDYIKAIEWYKKAAEFGNVYSYNNLGSCYSKLGNYAEAVKWYQLAADNNNSYALNNLALLYWNGLGVESDKNKAKNLFIKAIENGNEYAYSNLGKLYLEEEDYGNALKYLLLAEEAKDCPIDNAYYLGLMYHNGHGCPRNLPLAKKYYDLSVSRGYSCTYSIEMIERDMEIDKYFCQGKQLGKLQYNYEGNKLNDFARKYAREMLSKSNSKGIRNFADYLVKNKIFGVERKNAILSDIKNEYKEIWDCLESKSKSSIVTGIYIYSTLVELGIDEYKDMDFSPVINELAKSFEIILKNFFVKGYLKYLKNNNLNYKDFIYKIEKNKNIKNIFENDDYNTFVENVRFSLGEVYYIITNGQKTNFVNGYEIDKDSAKGYKTRKSLLTGEFVNKNIISYFNEILLEDKFSSGNKYYEIANYLLDFANDIKTIREKRNIGSHISSLTIDEAEVCADFLIKVKKIMYNFLLNIKPEYRSGY